MKKIIYLVFAIALVFIGCNDSNKNNSEDINIEGEWHGEVVLKNGSKEAFTWNISYVNEEPLVESFTLAPNASTNAIVRGSSLSFSWSQGEQYDENLSAHPNASVLAEIQEDGNFLSGTISMGNPVETISFSASRLQNSQPLAGVENDTQSSNNSVSCDFNISVLYNGLAIGTTDESVVTDGEHDCIVIGNSGSGVSSFNKVVNLNRYKESEIYPGALLNGKQFKESQQLTYLQGVDRNGGTLVFEGAHMNGGNKVSVDISESISYDSVMNAIVAKQSEVNATAANLETAGVEYDSTKELYAKFKLGVSVEHAADLDSSMAYDRTTNVNYATYYAIQTYYIVNFEYPKSPSSAYSKKYFFNLDTMDENQCSLITDETNPPIYVSSVSYGKMFFATAESTYSKEEINAALSAAVEGAGTVSGEMESGVKYSDVLNSAKIHYLIWGGSGTGAAQELRVDNGQSVAQAWYNVVTDATTAEYSSSNPPVPVYYSLNNVADQTYVSLPYEYDYNSYNCGPHKYDGAKYTWKVHVKHDSIEDDLYYCVDGDEVHHVGLNNATHYWYIDPTASAHDKTLSLTLGNGKCFATNMAVGLYRKADTEGSTWESVWSKHYHRDISDCGWQFQRVFTVNRDGHQNKVADREKSAIRLGNNGKCATE